MKQKLITLITSFKSYGLLAIAGVFILGYLLINSKSNALYRETSLNKAYSHLSDTLVKTRNALNQEVAKTGVIQTESAKAFLSLKSKDAEVLRLQKLVGQEQGKGRDVQLALNVTTTSYYKLKDSTQNLVAYDSSKMYPKETVTMWPIYEHIIKDSLKWIQGTIKLGRKVFSAELEFKNDYSISVGEESKGWFEKQPYAEIVNHNPYTGTDAMKVYQKKLVPNKAVKSSLITGIAVFIGTFLLFK